MEYKIYEIVPSTASVAHINSKHGVTLDDVEDACGRLVGKPVLHEDSERGKRLLVKGQAANGDLIKVILYPVNIPAGIWRLGTAYRV